MDYNLEPLPWNRPLFKVPKKAEGAGEKKWRLVIDYRKVNDKTVGDAYPLPDVMEILDQLSQSTYFSCIDMVMGYHHIEVAEQEFSAKEGHWEYKLLPFGFKTAPATFQRMMNGVLSGLTGSLCFVFLDALLCTLDRLPSMIASCGKFLTDLGKII